MYIRSSLFGGSRYEKGSVGRSWGWVFASRMPEFLYDGYIFISMCTSGKEDGVKEGDLCCGRTWSETWTRRRGYVFANVDAVLKRAPYEIISILWRVWNSERGWRRKASYGERVGKIAARAARIIRKINYFPGLLINFTITLPSFPSSLSQFCPFSVGGRGTREVKRERERESLHGCLVSRIYVCIGVHGLNS